MALGNRERLTVTLTAKDWELLFDECKKQTLIGIAFAGIEKLPLEQCPSKPLVLRWSANVNKAMYRNDEMNEKCAKVYKYFANEGFYSCVLKGQSNLANYPEEMGNYRSPGDIDILVAPKQEMELEVHDKRGKTRKVKLSGKEAVIEYIQEKYRAQGKDVRMPEVNYHHVDWMMDGVETEVHFRASWMNNPVHNRRLQKWCEENAQWDKVMHKGFCIPSVEYNVVYQLVHVYRHLFNEGIGLRQLLDYYMVLRVFHIKSKMSKEEVMKVLDSFDMRTFAGAVMWLLSEVFAMPKEWLICEPKEKEGRFLLDEVMLSGNFGKHDARNVINSNESYLHRFVRRQKRFLRFFTQYPSEVFWGPYFTFSQRWWRISNGYR